MQTAVMFSRASDEWSTPQDVFDDLLEEFHFGIDLAASHENAKCPLFYHRGRNALEEDWSSAARIGWLNPPYSQVAAFVGKAARQAERGFTTVMLIPSRTDTRYWHEHIWDTERHRPRPGVEVRFLKGRLKFGESQNSAPFPSVVIVFRPV